MENNLHIDVLIVGGGAAGFFAGIHLKTLRPHLNVHLIEAGHQPLSKVKISGGGRCNVTHHCFDAKAMASHYPRGEKELLGIFQRFGARDTIAWFERCGVPLKTEPDGRIFPVSDESQTIIDCLLQQAARYGLTWHNRYNLMDLKRDEQGGWLATFQHPGGDITVNARAVLLTTGGNPRIWNRLSTLGQPTMAPAPSLFTLAVAEDWIRALSGVSMPAVSLSLPQLKKVPPQRGPLLLTHWGLSGPATLRLSAWGARALQDIAYQTQLLLDWLPDLSWHEVQTAIQSAKVSHAVKQMGNACPFVMPKRLWMAILETRSTTLPSMAWAHITKGDAHWLVEALKRLPLMITGKGPFKEEFVMAGGVTRKSVDFKTMQSRMMPSLFFAGEVLDIDGLTGGFNFQNAWSTAWVSAEGIAQYL